MRMPMTVRPGTRLRYSESAGVLRRRALYTTDALAPLAGSAASTTLSRTRAARRHVTSAAGRGSMARGVSAARERSTGQCKDRTVRRRHDSEARIHLGELAFEGRRGGGPFGFLGAGQVDWQGRSHHVCKPSATDKARVMEPLCGPRPPPPSQPNTPPPPPPTPSSPPPSPCTHRQSRRR